MNFIERMGLAALHRFDPETAHGLALKALEMEILPLNGVVTSTRLLTKAAGLTFGNPIGLAAGFDKNATAVGPLSRAGFGFIEVGAATPMAQPGNDKPRLFRLTEDRAAINRFGFNNDGMEAIAQRLAAHKRSVPVGLNLGANKTSTDRAADFARVLTKCGPHIDFATVNVSSPNTEKLRDLQGPAALSALLSGVMEARDALERQIPIFLKIAPDLTEDEIAEIGEVAVTAGLAGIITTNTTLSREGLSSVHRTEAGGLSGAPLFERSTRVLAQLSKATEGRLTLIGVGGVSTAEQAYEKLRAGASLVQVYTAMVFEGIGLATRMANELDEILRKNGHTSAAEVVGTGRDRWL